MSIYFMSFSLALVLSAGLCLAGSFFKSRWQRRACLLVAVLLGWYLLILDTRLFYEAAWEAYDPSSGLGEPNDSGPLTFATLFGWVVPLVVCLLVLALKGVLIKIKSQCD